jgi:hypothetical protein
LIGWTSTADPLENVARSTLNFFTQEDAEAFCKKHGWKYEVLSPKEQSEARPRRFIGYGDNFRQALWTCMCNSVVDEMFFGCHQIRIARSNSAPYNLISTS